MTPALDFRGATVVRSGRAILDAVDWTVRPDERWIVLGRNGSGKTTLLRLASCYLHPTAGTVEVLGGRLGRVDVRTLRAQIGLTSAALAESMGVAATRVERAGDIGDAIAGALATGRPHLVEIPISAPE